MTETPIGAPAPETLPEDLLYAEDGHASDVALTCLADGEEALIPQAVRAHVSACPRCAGHLGNAALLSLRADHELRAAHARTNGARTAPSPARALALGLLVAVLAAVPRLATLPEEVAGAGQSLTHGAPSFLRLLHELGGLAARSLDERHVAVSLFTTLALVACALGVLRRATRPPVRA